MSLLFICLLKILWIIRFWTFEFPYLRFCHVLNFIIKFFSSLWILLKYLYIYFLGFSSCNHRLTRLSWVKISSSPGNGFSRKRILNARYIHEIFIGGDFSIVVHDVVNKRFLISWTTHPHSRKSDRTISNFAVTIKYSFIKALPASTGFLLRATVTGVL